MITIPILIEKLQKYANMQLAEIASTNPMMGFVKPLLSRAINNTISKAEKTLALLADKEGNIDTDSILTEMIDNLMTTQPFVINTSFIGDIVVGNGTIKINIPYTERNLVFNSSDLQKLKEMLNIKG
jgi:hypothetical protein